MSNITPIPIQAGVLDYWAKRGEVAAGRLIKHGVPASFQVLTQSGPDGQPVRTVSFEIGALGHVIMAELIADRLDEIQAAIDQAAAEQRIDIQPPVEGSHDGDDEGSDPG